MKKHANELIYRILDANLNRAAEGMRVCEEVARFILNDKTLTAQLKNMRHTTSKVLDPLMRKRLISKRDSSKDVGRKLLCGELKRGSYQDIFFANIQRVKESSRVLEEFLKLVDLKAAVKLKKIRYNAYKVEKKVTVKFSNLPDTR